MVLLNLRPIIKNFKIFSIVSNNFPKPLVVKNIKKISTSKIFFQNLEEQKKQDSIKKQVPAQTYFTKQRLNKKKTKKISLTSSIPSFKVKAYSTADYYDLDALKVTILNSKAYDLIDIGEDILDNCFCIKPKYQEVNQIEPRHIFIFEDGSVVFWNLSNEEQNSILEMIEKHEENSYPVEFVNEESEVMTYSRLNSLYESESQEKPKDYDLFNLIKLNSDFNLTLTRLVNNHIYFSDNKNHLLEKYSFSDAIALSVKLGIYEKNLDQFTEKIEFISNDLRYGKHLKLKSEEVLKYLGELFTMRHVVNLHSNFLDTPDFYWDRENLEQLYTQLYSHLSIGKRTRSYNEKLNHCIDLMEIIKQHLSDNKHTRLEWIIIGLITIEVLSALGILDLIKTYSVNTIDFVKNKIL